MGNLSETDPLKHPWFLEQLDGFAERVGMSWFKSRMRQLTAEAMQPRSPERLERIEYLLEQIGREPAASTSMSWCSDVSAGDSATRPPGGGWAGPRTAACSSAASTWTATLARTPVGTP